MSQVIADISQSVFSEPKSGENELLNYWYKVLYQ